MQHTHFKVPQGIPCWNHGTPAQISLWDWDLTNWYCFVCLCCFCLGGRSTTLLSHTANQPVISAWLSNNPTKDRMEITNLVPNQTLSVNSLDVLGSCLVCGTDAEAIYVNRHLFA
uniref:Uncharacterized protein n=1 Tax=Gopherus agassizii TaxID=38772 RepID=A0A452IIV3_9SAUR